MGFWTSFIGMFVRIFTTIDQSVAMVERAAKAGNIASEALELNAEQYIKEVRKANELISPEITQERATERFNQAQERKGIKRDPKVTAQST